MLQWHTLPSGYSAGDREHYKERKGYLNLVLLKFIVSNDANIHEIQEYAEAEHHYNEMKEVPIISPI